MNDLKDFAKTMAVAFFPARFRKRNLQTISNLSWAIPPDEEAELMLLPYFLKKDKLFFDIGANNGIYTTAAEMIIPGKMIYSFEPIKELYSRLKSMHKKINLFSIALSNEISEKQFKIPVIQGKEFKSRGTLQVKYLEEGETGTRLIRVKSETLDNFVKRNKISNIGFVKIDVEGHELHVIEGGVATIGEQKPVLQIEIEQRHYEKRIKEIINYIEDLGYECHYLDIDGGEFRRLATDPATIQKSEHFKTSKYIHNFIFLPTDKKWDLTISKINNDIIKARKSNS